MRAKRTWFHAAAALASLLSAAVLPVLGNGPALDGPDLAGGVVAMRGVFFVPNQGQWADESVYYAMRSRGMDLAFRESALSMHLARPIEDASNASQDNGSAPPRFASLHDDRRPLRESPGVDDFAPADEHLTLTVSFPGSNAVTPRGAQPQAARFNYFVGGEGRGSASNVPSFASVVYENLYEGIDLHVKGSEQGVLKYEFHCAPGADWSQIWIHYDGVDSLCIDHAGTLSIETAAGTLADGAPNVWQYDERSRDVLPAHFELIDETTYRIAVTGPVDSARELVIDPDVAWMLYLGGSGSVDYAYAAAVDSAGNTLVTGETESRDFEGRINESHGWDAFLAKVDRSGDLVWVTFLGGRGYESGRAIALNERDDAFIAGNTNSLDFDGRTNSNHAVHLADDGFVLRVDASGSLQWMTYIGGGLADGSSGVAVDANGDVVVAGHTGSDDVEGSQNAPHGHSDAYLAKVDGTGTLQWVTYLGGSEDDFGAAVRIDRDGNAVFTGQTTSDDFEGRINEYQGEYSDVFVVKVSPSGGVQWMTYLGGTKNEFSTGMALDSQGNILVSGATISEDFEGRLNERNRRGAAFLLKLETNGTLIWMTYLGGSEPEEGLSVAVDSYDNAYVVGWTFSLDFFGQLNHLNGVNDAYVVKVDSTGSPEWMYYLGGSDYDVAVAVAIDITGEALVAGHTQSLDFDGRLNEKHGGQHDAFVVRVSTTRPRLSVTSTCPSGGPIGVEWRDATPDAPAVLLFARNSGAFSIPEGNPCSGTVLGLGTNLLQAVLQINSDSDGSRTLNATAGPGACGGHLQLLDVTVCTPSNVVRIE